MPEKAHVASVEALEIFRASLIIYQDKARPTLEQVRTEVLRLLDWLQHDQTAHWKNQIRRRAKVLEEAQNALFSAQMADPDKVPDAAQMAFRRARRSLDEAEARLKKIRWWIREFDHQIGPLLKKFERLQNYLASDLPRAVAYLSQAVDTLVEYSSSAFGQTSKSTPRQEREGEPLPPSSAPAQVEPEPGAAEDAGEQPGKGDS